MPVWLPHESIWRSLLKHQKPAPANLSQNGVYGKGANNIDRVEDPDLDKGFWNWKDIPKAVHRTGLAETPSSTKTLDTAIDLGIGDHMGNFVKSGFTAAVGTKGWLEWVWEREGEKEVEPALTKEVPVGEAEKWGCG